MNKNIKLAVAGAILATASAANAGIVIPAGEWTLDVNGNVNAYVVHNTSSRATAITGAVANAAGTTGSNNASSINTGLLPAWIGFTGTTRQNDLDVSFTISIQPGASNTGALSGGLANYGVGEQRQTFMTIGDKSWGSFKFGKDLGIFGSDAILNDITLLGVGTQGVVGTAGGTTTTLGGIGSGYIYADWKGQLSYTTPNMSGFQATVGLMQPWDATSAGDTGASSGISAVGSKQRMLGYEGKASYSFSANDVNGKIWVGGISQKAYDVYAIGNSPTAYAGEVGASVTAGMFNVVGYYYAGEGAGTTGFLRDGFSVTGKKRDSDGGYIQATVKLPTQTKIGIAYGKSNLDRGTGDTSSTDIVKENERYTVGAYHPLTKHLNLVAEYTHVESTSNNAAAADNKSNIVNAGAILFF